MLSVEKVKEILKNEKMSNEEALEIRNNLYGLAEVAIEKYIEDNKINVMKK